MMLNRLSCIVVALSILGGSTGCTVLTRNEVAAVGRFAAVAKDYSDLPGAVIERHAAIRKERQVLKVSTFADGDKALAGVESALRQEETLTEKGREADQALQVLSDYAELLSELTADSYTDEIDSAAQSLGAKVDKGIGQYNKVWNRSVATRGSTVAAVVRGAGGVYLRARQAKALKEVVPAADPLVQALARTVEETMSLYLDAGQLQQAGVAAPGEEALVPGGLLTEERTDVALFYRGVAGLYQGKQPPELPLKVAEVMQSSDAAALLAAKTLRAAATFRQAHAQLAEEVQGKRSLASAIQQVQALADEVKGAREAKKKLDTAAKK